MERFVVLLVPPILQTAFTIVFAAVRVKGMGNFMPNDDADAAQIGTARSLGIIKRRLQDAGRDGDTVVFRNVGGIDILGIKGIPLIGIEVLSQQGVDLLFLQDAVMHDIGQ